MKSTASNDLKFELQVSRDGLTVSLRAAYSLDQITELASQILQEMERLGIANPPSRDDVLDALEDAVLEGMEVDGLPLLKGQAPIPPKEGRMEWARDFFNEGFAVDEETGTMDYRDRLGNPNVEDGEYLGVFVPPVPGADGLDVFGKTIPCEPCKPFRVSPGPNVRADDAGVRFYATHFGRVRFSACKISVDPVLTINGNVGLETGNIDHPGAVLIEGDVEAGSSVRAQGDIEIHGVVESADIDAGGDLYVRRGITGHGKQPIRAGGTVRTRFLMETTLQAEDDIAVESETVNSRVSTSGSFLMPGGRLVGGAVQASGYIYVKQAGSDGQVRTILAIAMNEALANEIAAREHALRDSRESLEKIHATLAAVKGKTETLKSEARTALAKLALRSRRDQRNHRFPGRRTRRPPQTSQRTRTPPSHRLRHSLLRNHCRDPRRAE